MVEIGGLSMLWGNELKWGPIDGLIWTVGLSLECTVEIGGSPKVWGKALSRRKQVKMAPIVGFI